MKRFLALLCVGCVPEAPTVTITTDPPHLETAVAADIRPTVHYDGAVLGLDDHTFVLKRFDLTLVAGTATQVDPHTITFIPDEPLAPDDYILVVEADPVKFPEGGGTTSWFATYSNPTIRDITVDDTTVVVSFTQAIDPATISDETIIVWGRSPTNKQRTPRGESLSWQGGRHHILHATVPPDTAHIEVELLPGLRAADGIPVEAAVYGL